MLPTVYLVLILIIEILPLLVLAKINFMNPRDNVNLVNTLVETVHQKVYVHLVLLQVTEVSLLIVFVMKDFTTMIQPVPPVYTPVKPVLMKILV